MDFQPYFMNLLDKITEKIKYLRVQPESVKNRYVFVSAIIVVIIVGLLWVKVFKKYEKRPESNGRNFDLINAGEKIKKDFEEKIKIPNFPPAADAPKAESMPKNDATSLPELSPSL